MNEREAEVWRPIPLLEGYSASNLGNIKKEDKLCKQYNDRGYRVISKCFNRRAKNYAVHRLVADAFGISTENFIDHINGDRSDNRLCNLRAATLTENTAYAYGRNPDERGVYLKDSGNYQSSAYMKGKKYNLGTYTNKEASLSVIDGFHMGWQAALAYARTFMGEVTTKPDSSSEAVVQVKDDNLASPTNKPAEFVSIGVEDGNKVASANQESDSDFLKRVGTNGRLWAEEMSKQFGISFEDVLVWCCNMLEAKPVASVSDDEAAFKAWNNLKYGMQSLNAYKQERKVTYMEACRHKEARHQQKVRELVSELPEMLDQFVLPTGWFNEEYSKDYLIKAINSKLGE